MPKNKSFERYLKNTREKFIKAVNEKPFDAQFRVECENLIIAFDQLHYEYTKDRFTSGNSLIKPDDIDALEAKCFVEQLRSNKKTTVIIL